MSRAASSSSIASRKNLPTETSWPKPVLMRMKKWNFQIPRTVKTLTVAPKKRRRALPTNIRKTKAEVYVFQTQMNSDT